MAKVAVVYWSGTGNTETMANLVAQGATSKGAEVEIFSASDFNSGMVSNYDALAFGCPSMGAEVLEECDFQPMWDDVKETIGDKKVVLFGSYGWGDGEWMRNWAEEANPIDTFICNDAPDDDAEESCKSLGEKLV